MSFKFVLGLLASVVLCGVCFAQVQTTTGITGIVTDETGAVVPGVEITATDQDTGAVRTVVTNDVGYYSFQSLKPGTYTITASLAGFKTFVLKDRQLLVAIPAQVNITMQIGELSQSVTVSGVGEELVNKTTVELSTTINQDLVQNLPNETRNYFDLLALAPNTSPQYLHSSMSFGQHSMRRVNAANSFESSGVFAAGERDSASNVSIDGANSQFANYNQTVTIQSSSTIKELRLQTASANAEFGYGSNAVNVITKSGTNDFHGEVFWQHRNNNLDAVPFFTNLAGNVLPEYKRNKFGATLGGPIIKDKLLFFANYEGSRLRQAVQGNARVPTALERSGDFSQTRLYGPGNVLLEPRTVYNTYEYDAITGLRAPFPNNKIPANMLDPGMQVLLKYTPLPNVTNLDGIPQYSGLNRTEMDENQHTARIDWQKSEKTLVYGRWTAGERQAYNTGLFPPLTGERTPASSKTIVINWNQVVSPTMINDVSVSYSRPKWGIGRPIKDVADVSAEMGLKNASLSGLAGSPAISITDFSVAASSNYVWDPTQNTYQAKDDFSYTRGRHSFKTGVHYTDRRLYYLVQSVDKGYFTFLQTYTNACPLGKTVCNQARTAAGLPEGGHALADALLGAINTLDLQLKGVVWHGQQPYVGTYLQDTWQVNQKLTINMGLRYEYWRPWTLPRNATIGFERSGEGRVLYALQNPLDVYDPAKDYGRKAPLVPDFPRQAYRTSNRNLAPRIGFAYTVTPDTVIRLAGGIFFAGNINVNQFADIQSGGAPFTLQGVRTTSRAEQLPPYIVKDSFDVPSPTTIPAPYSTPLSTVRALVEEYWPSPAVYQWSLGVQHRFNPSWAANFDYIGSHTIHNSQTIQHNAAELPQGDLADVPLQERRPFKGWGNITGWVPWGSQHYHSGTVGIKNRDWKGLSMMSNLTWAKALSTSASVYDSDAGNRHYRYYDIWRGRTNFIPTLRSITAWSYNLPFGSKMKYKLHGIADAVAGGWVVSGITEFSTGAPVNTTYTDNTGTGVGNQMADRVAGCDINDAAKDRFQWFNTACFAVPEYGHWGTASANLVDSPGLNNWNITVKKSFTLHESHQVEFRTELYNAFNHTQWGPPTTSLASSSFGRIGSTRTARQLQFSLFYTF